MDKTFMIYDAKYVLEKINAVSNQMKFVRYDLAGEYFGLPIKDSRVIDNMVIVLAKFLEKETKSQFMVKYNYIFNLFNVVKAGRNLENKITFDIPYGRREDYYAFVYEVNNLVGGSGIVDLYVNNIPYPLSSYLVVETDGNFEMILKLSEQYRVCVNIEQGFDELFESMGGRQFDSYGFIQNMTFEEVKNIMSQAYKMVSQYTLKSKGYRFDVPKKPRLFISYSHKDAEQVNHIVSKFNQYGLYFWQDRYELMPGDLLMQKVHEDMQECDLPIVFISKKTNDSHFAKHELTTFFSDIIYQSDANKKWFIVNLDGVNPDEIYKGLGSYFYFDLGSKTVEQLVEMIDKKIERH